MADNNILNRLDGLKLKFEEIGQQMTDPEVIGDMKKFVQLNKEYKELKPIIETSERYRTAVNNLREAKDILANEKDEDLREMAREEVAELEPAIDRLEEEIKLLLIPKDPQDEKNAIVEIRGGTGGDEAALFAGDLLRMYTKYAESKGWKYEINSASEGSSGGYKEVVMKVTGDNVYGTAQVRIGRTPRAARAADRNAGPRPHLGRIGSGAAGGGGVRHRAEHERHPQGHVLLVGPRRPVGQYHLLGHPPDTHPYGHRRTVPGPEVAAQELRQGPRRAAHAHLQPRIPEVSRRDSRQAQNDGFDG